MVAAKQYTYGDSLAITVLVGQRMSLSVGCVDVAEKQLKGEKILPVCSKGMESEAIAIHNEIAKSEALVTAANAHAEEIKKAYGFL